MKVYLTHSDFNLGYELFPVSKRLAAKYEKETGNESILFQTDWDFPGLAQSLGWNIRKAHKRNCPEPGSTDGTVTCKGCGLGASHFISAAQEWLDKRADSVFRGSFEEYFSL